MPTPEPGRQRFDLTLPDAIANMIKVRAAQDDKPYRQVVEELIQRGLTQEERATIDRYVLPLLREAVSSELARGLTELRHGIHDDMNRVAGEHSVPLARLVLRAIVESSAAGRLTYSLLQHIGITSKSQEATIQADELLKEARRHARRTLARIFQADNK